MENTLKFEPLCIAQTLINHFWKHRFHNYLPIRPEDGCLLAMDMRFKSSGVVWTNAIHVSMFSVRDYVFLLPMLCNPRMGIMEYGMGFIFMILVST